MEDTAPFMRIKITREGVVPEIHKMMAVNVRVDAHRRAFKCVQSLADKPMLDARQILMPWKEFKSAAASKVGCYGDATGMEFSWQGCSIDELDYQPVGIAYRNFEPDK
jgi:hypothetical protein